MREISFPCPFQESQRCPKDKCPLYSENLGNITMISMALTGFLQYPIPIDRVTSVLNDPDDAVGKALNNIRRTQNLSPEGLEDVRSRLYQSINEMNQARQSFAGQPLSRERCIRENPQAKSI